MAAFYNPRVQKEIDFALTNSIQDPSKSNNSPITTTPEQNVTEQCATPRTSVPHVQVSSAPKRPRRFSGQRTQRELSLQSQKPHIDVNKILGKEDPESGAAEKEGGSRVMRVYRRFGPGMTLCLVLLITGGVIMACTLPFVKKGKEEGR